MTAMTSARLTPMRPDCAPKHVIQPQVHDGVVIWEGGLVVLDKGKAAPGRSGAGLTVLGIARDTVDNRTYPTALYRRTRRVSVVSGIAQLENSGGADAIGEADVGELCFMVDDRTLARTDGGGTRSPAGRVHEVERHRVWVDLGIPPRALAY